MNSEVMTEPEECFEEATDGQGTSRTWGTRPSSCLGNLRRDITCREGLGMLLLRVGGFMLAYHVKSWRMLGSSLTTPLTCESIQLQ